MINSEVRAKATWTGAISLRGLTIPIKLYVANREDKLKFSTVERATGEKIRAPYISTVTGEEVERTACDKKYTFDDGREAIVSQAQLDTVEHAKTKLLHIKGFVSASLIDPSLYAATHQIGADEFGDTGLAMLARALKSRGMVGIATVVKGTHERLCSIRAYGNQMFLHELFWPDEIREVIDAGDCNDQEMIDLADALVTQMSMDWDHSSYANTYKQSVLDMLERVATGEEVADAVEPDLPDPSYDVMAGLKAALDA